MESWKKVRTYYKKINMIINSLVSDRVLELWYRMAHCLFKVQIYTFPCVKVYIGPIQYRPSSRLRRSSPYSCAWRTSQFCTACRMQIYTPPLPVLSPKLLTRKYQVLLSFSSFLCFRDQFSFLVLQLSNHAHGRFNFQHPVRTYMIY